jgi:Flp pilus assembly pilin Flp
LLAPPENLTLASSLLERFVKDSTTSSGRAIDNLSFGGHDADSYARSATPGVVMVEVLSRLWAEDRGQDIAEYAVMLAVILVIVVGTIRLIGSNANNAFSSVASSIQ